MQKLVSEIILTGFEATQSELIKAVFINDMFSVHFNMRDNNLIAIEALSFDAVDAVQFWAKYWRQPIGMINMLNFIQHKVQRILVIIQISLLVCL